MSIPCSYLSEQKELQRMAIVSEELVISGDKECPCEGLHSSATWWLFPGSQPSGGVRVAVGRATATGVRGALEADFTVGPVAAAEELVRTAGFRVQAFNHSIFLRNKSETINKGCLRGFLHCFPSWRKRGSTTSVWILVPPRPGWWPQALRMGVKCLAQYRCSQKTRKFGRNTEKSGDSCTKETRLELGVGRGATRFSEKEVGLWSSPRLPTN